MDIKFYKALPPNLRTNPNPNPSSWSPNSSGSRNTREIKLFFMMIKTLGVKLWELRSLDHPSVK